VAVAEAFAALRPAIAQGTRDDWRRVADILSKPPFEKKAFKRTFNAYADNIYYSNPDQANLYLLGGAVPTSKQTIQYLYRNDALDNLEQLRDELLFLVADDDPSPAVRPSPADALAYHDKASAALDTYMGLVPAADKEEAHAVLLRRSTTTR